MSVTISRAIPKQLSKCVTIERLPCTPNKSERHPGLLKKVQTLQT